MDHSSSSSNLMPARSQDASTFSGDEWAPNGMRVEKLRICVSTLLDRKLYRPDLSIDDETLEAGSKFWDWKASSSPTPIVGRPVEVSTSFKQGIHEIDHIITVPAASTYSVIPQIASWMELRPRGARDIIHRPGKGLLIIDDGELGDSGPTLDDDGIPWRHLVGTVTHVAAPSSSAAASQNDTNRMGGGSAESNMVTLTRVKTVHEVGSWALCRLHEYIERKALILYLDQSPCTCIHTR